jgi:hypothetical protein
MEQHGDNGTETGGWVTTRQAARALNVIPRQVRNYIAAGDLEGRTRAVTRVHIQRRRPAPEAAFGGQISGPIPRRYR